MIPIDATTILFVFFMLSIAGYAFFTKRNSKKILIVAIDPRTDRLEIWYKIASPDGCITWTEGGVTKDAPLVGNYDYRGPGKTAFLLDKSTGQVVKLEMGDSKILNSKGILVHCGPEILAEVRQDRRAQQMNQASKSNLEGMMKYLAIMMTVAVAMVSVTVYLVSRS